MGGYLSSNCCAGREDAATKASAKERLERGWNFLEGEKSLTDSERFDQAFATNNLDEYVALISSEEKIASLTGKMHPWAADPATVGALSITQLAIIAAKEDEPENKDRIREAGAIPIMVAGLSSPEIDRVHAAVVALSFLTVDNAKNCHDLFDNGALPKLVRLLDNSLEGLRGAVAQMCRNIYTLDIRYRSEFQRLGGIPLLVAMLDMPREGEELFNQVEAVYHVEDLIIEAGEELPEFVQAAKKAGAVRRLEALAKCKDKEVADAAQYLLVRLAD